MKLSSLITAFFLTNAAAADILPSRAPEPADNPGTPAKIALGKELFFDPRLSKAGRTSCLTCHNVFAGGEDNRAFAIKPDGKGTGRSVPTVWNAAFLSSLFWYGQASSLEEQAEGPLEEMGEGDLNVISRNVARIPGYKVEFRNVFGVNTPISIKTIAQAIAAYERTLITPNSPYDRFLKGSSGAISDSVKRGLVLFRTIGCVGCHSGANFSGPQLKPGEGWYRKFPQYPDSVLEEKYHFSVDQGRIRITGREEDRHVFRVPTLRNIALTAPYFHNGAVKTLAEAVAVMAKIQLNRVLSVEEIDAIVAFLNSLTGRFPKQTMPRLPEYRNHTLAEGDDGGPTVSF